MIYTPVNDAPRLGFFIQACATATMVWYRAIYWVVLSYQIATETYSMSQKAKVGLFPMCFSAMSILVFTIFNLDFVKYHIKVLGISYQRLKRALKTGTASEKKLE